MSVNSQKYFYVLWINGLQFTLMKSLRIRSFLFDGRLRARNTRKRFTPKKKCLNAFTLDKASNFRTFQTKFLKLYRLEQKHKLLMSPSRDLLKTLFSHALMRQNPRELHSHCENRHVNNQAISQAGDGKYLGVYWVVHMTWRQHIWTNDSTELDNTTLSDSAVCTVF